MFPSYLRNVETLLFKRRWKVSDDGATRCVKLFFLGFIRGMGIIVTSTFGKLVALPCSGEKKPVGLRLARPGA